MAEDKDVSQITNQASSLVSTDRFYLGRYSGGVWYDYIITGETLQDVIEDIAGVTAWSDPEALDPNTTHYKNVGVAATYCGAIIKFVFRRNDKVYYGKVAIINDETDCYQNLEGAYEMPSQSLGIDIPYVSQINAEQQQWTITIDDSDSYETWLQYQIEVIPRPEEASA